MVINLWRTEEFVGKEKNLSATKMKTDIFKL